VHTVKTLGLCHATCEAFFHCIPETKIRTESYKIEKTLCIKVTQCPFKLSVKSKFWRGYLCMLKLLSQMFDGSSPISQCWLAVSLMLLSTSAHLNLFNHIAKFCCSFDKLHFSFFCNFSEDKKSCTTQIAFPHYLLIQKHVFIAEFWRPKGLPSATLCSYRKEKETHEWIFTWLILSLASSIAPGRVCTTTATMAALFDIGLSCHGQLTNVKTSYLLTGIT